MWLMYKCMGSPILLTGANGFLGSTIAKLAAELGTPIKATDRATAASCQCGDYTPVDILDPSQLPPVLSGAGCVIHAAGLAHVFGKRAADAPFHEVNVLGTANVARAAAEAGVTHFVLVSSVSVYGSSLPGGTEESAPCRPDGAYAQSKWEAEVRATEIAQDSGMALTILRMATIYGEGDRGNIARLMRAIDRGSFIWVGSGSNRKSLIHKEDAARAVLTAALSRATGVSVYNVSAPPCTMREVVQCLAAALGRHLPPLRVPTALARAGGAVLSWGPLTRAASLRATLNKWLADDVYNAARFSDTFGFTTQVGLTEGIAREVAWYRGLGETKSS